MSCNWAGSLDMLAQNGVIDFDAASYIMGQPLRYVGNPAHPNPFNGQPPTMTNLQHKGGQNAAKLAQRTRYVATRPGVELLADERSTLLATKKGRSMRMHT